MNVKKELVKSSLVLIEEVAELLTSYVVLAIISTHQTPTVSGACSVLQRREAEKG